MHKSGGGSTPMYSLNFKNFVKFIPPVSLAPTTHAPLKKSGVFQIKFQSLYDVTHKYFDIYI